MVDNIVVPIASGYGLANEYHYLKDSIKEYLTGISLFPTFLRTLKTLITKLLQLTDLLVLCCRKRVGGASLRSRLS